MTSRERGRMPGSVEVPVTVYVLPSVGNGSVQQLKWCLFRVPESLGTRLLKWCV